MARFTGLPSISAFRFAVTAAGTAEQIGAKRRAATIAFNNNSATNSADTITDSGNAFLTSGIRSGDVITITGAAEAGNNSTFTVATAAAGTLTLTRSGVLTTEAASATVRIVANKMVPDGVSVTVRAINGNTGNIFLSDLAAGATSTAGIVLRQNESVELTVSNTNAIFVDAGTSGDGVEVLFEKSLQGS